MNKLRTLTIEILEKIEEHIEQHKKPFDEEPYYDIEDEVYDMLYEYMVGEDDYEMLNRCVCGGEKNE